MERYKNLDGDSAIVAFESDAESITIEFNDGAAYRYTYQSAGVINVEEMKLLASRGRGLNGFINRNVKKGYAGKVVAGKI
jgi:hypothetical protein